MQKQSEKFVKLLGDKVWQYAEVLSEDLVFSQEVVEACKKNYCGKYNKTWMCPPAVGKLEDLKKRYTKYKYCFFFTTKHDIEDSFDIEGMFAARKVHDEAADLLLEETAAIGGVLLGPGGCSRCDKCAYPDNPCRFPGYARPGIEAVGVNVMQLAEKGKINYINGENTVTYFSVIFFD